MVKEQRVGSRREQARQLRKALIAERKKSMKQPRPESSNITGMEKIRHTDEDNRHHEIALKLAQDHKVPTRDDRIIQIIRLLDKENPKLDEVEQLWNPVNLFWSTGVSIDPTGQVTCEFPAKLPELSEFIKPNHIYLDVTDATRKDILAVLGRRLTRAEAERNIPVMARKMARSIMVLLESQDLRVPATKLENTEAKGNRLAAQVLYLKRFGVPPPRDQSNYTEDELVGYFEMYYRRELRSNPASIIVSAFQLPTTVVGFQDLMITNNMKLPHQRPGRAKGEPRRHNKWLGEMTRPELIAYLRDHPDQVRQKLREYLDERVAREREKRKANGEKGKRKKLDHDFLNWPDPLSPSEIRSIRARAKKNFQNLVMQPLRKAGTI